MDQQFDGVIIYSLDTPQTRRCFQAPETGRDMQVEQGALRVCTRTRSIGAGDNLQAAHTRKVLCALSAQISPFLFCDYFSFRHKSW
jgi:hypothetical protein